MTQTRKLGEFEQVIAPPTICNVAVPTKLYIKKEINVSLLEKSVNHFIHLQPNLKSGIKKINECYHFVPLEKIEDVFEVLPEDTHWKNICLKYARTLLRENFEKFSPLKVFFIPPRNMVAYLIPVFAHYCGDGINGMPIVNNILEIYDQMKKGIVHVKEFLPPPSVYDMAASALGENKEIYKRRFIENQIQQKQKCTVSVPFDDGVPFFYCYTSSEDTYKRFIKACKIHSVTVGTALMAAMTYGISALIFHTSNKKIEEMSISLDIPINVRGRVPLDIPIDCVNFSVTQNLISPTVSKEKKYWTLAQEIRNQVHENMSDKNLFHLFDFTLIDEIKNSEIFQKRKRELGGLSMIGSVSNMKR